MKLALIEILEFAKTHRDFATDARDKGRWSHVVQLAFEALGNPSIADIDKVKRFFTPKADFQVTE